MKHSISIALLAFGHIMAFAQPDARIDYIKQYHIIAQKEMQRAGIPASIKLAQAILESNAGQSTLAREANNHFGIKCHNKDHWNGKEYHKEDDDKDANGNLIKSCFRHYKKPEDSFEDHSEFLRDPKKYNRYGFLFNLNQQDYRSWCYGLQSSGYATSSTYAESLIRVIENYRLFEYDTPSGNIAGSTTPGRTHTGSGKRSRTGLGNINDVRTVRAVSGETIQDIARRYGLSPTRVACYNDCQIPVSQVLSPNDIVYVQHKRKKYRGRAKEHFVRQDETMFSIAQQYGVQLMSLYALNNMQGGTEPLVGERIRLKGWRKKSHSVRVRTDIPIKPPVVTQATQPKPGQPANVPMPTEPANQPNKTTDELFEIGKDTVVNNTPSTGTNGSGRPATTGTPRPDAPTIPTTTPSLPPVTTPGTPTTQPTTPYPTQPTAVAGMHTVVKGDTLYNISKRYGITVDQLRQMNNMATNDIKIGQVLKVKM